MASISEQAAHNALRERLGQGARYDAPSAPAKELNWARRGTAYFARKLNELGDADLDAPALQPGVLRRHVVASVGYQARMLALAVEAARTGVAPQEATDDDWQDQIEHGDTLPARALRNLFEHAEVHLNVEWRDLSDADWQKSISLGGRTVPIAQTPWLRSAAIWLHAVDLDNGGSFLDFPPDLLDALARELAGDASAPHVTLETTDPGSAMVIGSGTVATVGGSMADLVRWLTGRGARRLTVSQGSLPELPAKTLAQLSRAD